MLVTWERRKSPLMPLLFHLAESRSAKQTIIRQSRRWFCSCPFKETWHNSFITYRMVFLVGKATWQRCNPKHTEQSAKSENKWGFVCFKPRFRHIWADETVSLRWRLFVTLEPSSISYSWQHEHLSRFYSSRHVTEAVHVVSSSLPNIKEFKAKYLLSKKQKKRSDIIQTSR